MKGYSTVARPKNKKRSEFSQLPKIRRAPAPSPSLLPPVRGQETSALSPDLAVVKQLFDQGQRDQALMVFHQITEFNRQDAPLLEELGRALMQAKDFDSAAAIHRCWSQIDANNAKAFNALGASLASGGWSETGLTALQRAVVLAPEKAVYKFNLAKLYMLCKMYEQARSLLLAIANNYPPEKLKALDLLRQLDDMALEAEAGVAAR
jgi:Flp pilus assembly protein TadD